LWVEVINFDQWEGLFNLTTDHVINYDSKVPAEVILEDKTAVEQMRLIQQLDEDAKQTIFKLIDKNAY
jgi:hypothetical protein